MEKSALVLPWLPDNLESLNKEEEKNRTQSILYINSENNLKDHLDIIYSSLSLIYDITHHYKHETDDELTIQYLGIRLFNSIVTALKLALTGYYQISFMLIRDIVEVGFLLDYFSIDAKKINDWKGCTNSERSKKYKPSIIRDVLDKRDGLTRSKRSEVYQSLCEYAGHATYPGNKLVAPKGLGEIGPFFDKKYLTSVMGEMAMRVPWATIHYLAHFKKLPSKFLKPRLDFINMYKPWGQKYFKLDLSHVDTEVPKEFLKYL